MASAVSSVNTLANPVQGHFQNYLQARNAFDQAGGPAFNEDRRNVRSAYCKTAVSAETLAQWIAQLPGPAARDEFTRRFQKWDTKIAKRLLKKENPTIPEVLFIQTLQSFYETYARFLESPAFVNFTRAKAALKKDMLPALRHLTVETAARQMNIEDDELISRMESWKA